MERTYKQSILRILDANFNRYKEGLRVVEDIVRFIFENERLQKKIKKLRHGLDFILAEGEIKNSIFYRQANHDCGKKLDFLEIKRKDYLDILFTNFQRSKESIRVIEEFSKIIFPKYTRMLKRIRYDIYSCEKELHLYLKKLNKNGISK
ncbi:MAG: thiamine-phosphate pyrophosphorylase [Candidatus Omnitrophica bacterium]|nr:thiamine-phosphate pyrophosphorylase [Candidatus Omnitrophota bacterium]